MHHYPFLPPFFHWWQLPMLFAASIIGESYGSLIGGGSIVTMPALLLTGLPLQTAIAIDNTAALGTEAGIVSQTWEKIKNNKLLTLFMAIPIALGGVVGTWLLLNAPTYLLRYGMAAAVLFVVLHAYFGRKKVPTGTIRRRQWALLAVALFIVGVYSNTVSAGEGTVGKLTIMAVLGMSFMQSQGIKAMATMPSRFYMLIIAALKGMIVWPYLLTMWVSGFIAGRYATKFASRLPDKVIRVALTVISAVLVGYLLVGYKR